MPNSRYTDATRLTGESHLGGSGSGSGSGRSGSGSGSGSGRSGRGDSTGRPRPATNGELVNIPNPDRDVLTELSDFFTTDISDSLDAATGADSWLMQLMYYLKYESGGDRDALTNVAQLLLQYLQNEQNFQRNRDYAELNYQRSLASNQVDLMMDAGMSRAAALKALQGGSIPQSITADGVASSLPTDIEGHRTQRFQNILDAIDTSTRLANQLVSLASAPMDMQAKYITNKLLTNQSDLLEMQVQGLQDAAMFSQAVANVDSSNNGTKLADMPLFEQYSYFQKQSKMSPADSGFEPNAFYYGNSQSFARAAQNPFFWSAYADAVKNRNSANASIFDPIRAQNEVSQLRAATRLTQNQAFSEQFRSKILAANGFVDEYTAQARKDMEICKLQAEKAGFKFDKARADAFLERVDSFNAADFLALDYEIGRLSELNDPLVFSLQKNALVQSLDYQVAHYIYQQSLASLHEGVLSSELQTNPKDVYEWTKNYLRYEELGQDARNAAANNTARSVISGVTAGAASAFAGYKIYTGFANRAAQAAAAAGSTHPPLPFNLLAPIVASQPLLETMHPNFISNSMYGSGFE